MGVGVAVVRAKNISDRPGYSTVLGLQARLGDIRLLDRAGDKPAKFLSKSVAKAVIKGLPQYLLEHH